MDDLLQAFDAAVGPEQAPEPKPPEQPDSDILRAFDSITTAPTDHAARLDLARREVAAKNAETGGSAGRAVSNTYLGVLPFIGKGVQAVANTAYANAKDRYDQGKPEPTDYMAIAQHEADRAASEKFASTTAGTVAKAGFGTVGMAGEIATGGLPALVAAGTLEGASERAAAQGGGPMSPQNLLPSAASNIAGAAVFGTLGKFAEGIPTVAGKVLGGVGIGLGEQGIIDIVSGALDEFLPKDYQSGGKYGLAGQIKRGEFSEAGKSALSQAIPFLGVSIQHQLTKHVEAGGKLDEGKQAILSGYEAGQTQGAETAPAAPVENTPGWRAAYRETQETPVDQPASPVVPPGRARSDGTEPNGVPGAEGRTAPPANENPVAKPPIEELRAKDAVDPFLQSIVNSPEFKGEAAPPAKVDAAPEVKADATEMPSVDRTIEEITGGQSEQVNAAVQAATDAKVSPSDIAETAQRAQDEVAQQTRGVDPAAIEKRFARQYKLKSADKLADYRGLLERDANGERLSQRELGRLGRYAEVAYNLNVKEGSTQDKADLFGVTKQAVSKTPGKYGYEKPVEEPPDLSRAQLRKRDATEKDAVIDEAAAKEGRHWGGLIHESDLPVGFHNESPTFKNGVHDLWQDDVGAISIDTAKEKAVEAYRQAKNAADYTSRGLSRLWQQMTPDTTALNKDAGQQVARQMAARDASVKWNDYFQTKLFGNVTPEMKNLAGATLMELRMRYAKHNFAKNGEMDKANAVTTTVGMDGSPLRSNADFHAAVANPEVQRLLDAYQSEYVPFKEKYFKQSIGVDDAQPVTSKTQMPDMPVYAVAAEHEAPTLGKGGPKITNATLRKNKQAELAGLDAEKYNLDLGEIIKADIANTFHKATSHETYRTLEANGLGKWIAPGDDPTLANGREAQVLPFVFPPKGTQAAEKGQTQFAVDKQIYAELNHAFNTIETPELYKAARVATAPLSMFQMASGVDLFSHAINNAKFAFQPRHWPGLVKAVKMRLADSVEFKRVIADLATEGADKPSGFEGGGILPHGGGKFLDGMSRVMRVAASEAFDSYARTYNIENSPGAKRDFINQAFGNYNTAGQSGVVRALRQSGLNPFATANSTFLANSLSQITGGMGLKPQSWKASAGLRAERLATTAATLGMVMMANKAMWGRADGDDKIPVGTIKTGEDDKGQSQYIDPLAPIRRGWNALGGDALANWALGRGKNKTVEQVTDNAIQRFTDSVTRPMLGPPYEFYHTAKTGKDHFDKQIADKAAPDEYQILRNSKAAVLNQNNILSAITRADANPKDRQDNSRFYEWKRVKEAGKKMLGPLFPSTTHPSR